MPEKAMLFIHALTSLHPGSGTALEVVDLPVQRERHTRWPVIPGSTLKGILRDACREKVKEKYQDDEQNVPERERRTRRRRANEEDPELVAIFGPGKVDESSSHAGALSLTDARILAFPVRSLRGVFAWVTCPAVLERLGRDLALLMDADGLGTIPVLGKDQAVCAKASPLLVDNDKLVLEEFEFTRTSDAKEVAQWIADRAVSDNGTQERIKTNLAVLHDDDFTHFVRHATEVVARVGLDYERKTVKSGALFYEEFLPPETLFYSVAFAEDSRRKEVRMSAGDVLKYVEESLPSVLQIGGDETIGKGFCAVRLVNGKEAKP